MTGTNDQEICRPALYVCDLHTRSNAEVSARRGRDATKRHDRARRYSSRPSLSVRVGRRTIPNAAESQEMMCSDTRVIVSTYRWQRRRIQPNMAGEGGTVTRPRASSSASKPSSTLIPPIPLPDSSRSNHVCLLRFFFVFAAPQPPASIQDDPRRTQMLSHVQRQERSRLAAPPRGGPHGRCDHRASGCRPTPTNEIYSPQD